MGPTTQTATDRSGSGLNPTLDRWDEAIRALMQPIRESAAILQALRTKHERATQGDVGGYAKVAATPSCGRSALG